MGNMRRGTAFRSPGRALPVGGLGTIATGAGDARAACRSDRRWSSTRHATSRHACSGRGTARFAGQRQRLEVGRQGDVVVDGDVAKSPCVRWRRAPGSSAAPTGTCRTHRAPRSGLRCESARPPPLRWPCAGSAVPRAAEHCRRSARHCAGRCPLRRRPMRRLRMPGSAIRSTRAKACASPQSNRSVPPVCLNAAAASTDG